MKNLLIRTISGTVYVALILGAILGGEFAFTIIFGFIIFEALNEFSSVTKHDKRFSIFSLINAIAGVVIFYTAYLYIKEMCLFALPSTAIAYLILLFVFSIFFSKPKSFHSIVYAVFGQIYIVIPFILLMLMQYRFSAENLFHKNQLALAVFIFIWINDTAAFLVGSLLGKHKLAPRISPKKTIEGFFGGILLCAAAAFLLNYLFAPSSLIFWIGFAVVVSLLATLGDLFESVIKRTFNVKDAGKIIPGHGGVLDRIDSLLMVIPGIYLYLMLLEIFR